MAAAALAAMMAVSVLTGCGSQTKETAAKAEETKTESAGNVEAAGTASTTFPEKNIKIIRYYVDGIRGVIDSKYPFIVIEND